MYSRLDGALNMEEWQRPRQFLHPLPDSAWGLFGHRPAGTQLSLPVAHRRSGQRRGRLNRATSPSLMPLSLVVLGVLPVAGQHIP